MAWTPMAWTLNGRAPMDWPPSAVRGPRAGIIVSIYRIACELDPADTAVGVKLEQTLTGGTTSGSTKSYTMTMANLQSTAYALRCRARHTANGRTTVALLIDVRTTRSTVKPSLE